MAFWDEEEEPKVNLQTSWGSKALGMDEFFGQRGERFRGAPLGMGKLASSSMAPQVRSPMMRETSRAMRRSPMRKQTRVNPFARAAEQKKTLKEMEEQGKARAGGKTSTEWGEDAALAAELTLGVTLAKTKEERKEAISRAGMVGSMKALQYGVTSAIDYFDEDTAKEAVKAAATDETAKIIKNAGAMSKDASLLEDPAGTASGAISAIGLGADIVGGDNPAAATIEAGGALAGAKGGAMAGGTIGTAILPGAGTAIGTAVGTAGGAVAGRMAGQKLSEIAKLRKKRMQRGGGAVQDPSMYGGVSDYLA